MGNGQPYSETQVLRQLASGDATAFTQVYREYHPLVLAVALRLLKSESVAEDVCNDIFTSLWQNRAYLQEVVSLKAYLLTAARNRSLNALKSLSRSQAFLQDVRSSFPQKSLDTEAQLLEKEYRDFVRKGIDALPARAKEVFSLCREEGRSYEEVSAQLGISRNAVKAHMVLSMKKLKALAEKDLGISLSLFLFLFRSL